MWFIPNAKGGFSPNAKCGLKDVHVLGTEQELYRMEEVSYHTDMSSGVT